MRFWIFCSLLSVKSLFATQGIAVACNDYYIGYYLPMLAYLRLEHHSTIPVEIWYAGDELSDENKARLERFGNVTFHNVVDYFGKKPSDYWGFQIKGYMLVGSHFDEVMIADADVYFVQKPDLLFELPAYKKSGAYFFRDFPIKKFSDARDKINETDLICDKWEHGYLESYRARREFIRSKIDQPSKYVPKDMLIFWSGAEPTKENRFLSQYQEAGVVLIDKRRHQKGVEKIFQLNVDHKTTYHFVHGDKETYWMGMEMANEPYAFNDGYPVNVKGKWKFFGIKRHKIRLAHMVNGNLFWFQKKPVPLGRVPYLRKYKGEKIKDLRNEEIFKIDQIGYYISVYGKPTKEK